MKKILSLTLALIMMLALFGCAKGPEVPESSTPETPESSTPETPESSTPETPESNGSENLAQGKTIACCMGSINHPVHRIVQTGFMLKAEELGMKGVISGLDEGSIQELIRTWEDSVVNGATGVLVWTGDDSCYDMMKGMKEMGVYTVVPHFVHNYEDTKAFIDKNISCLAITYGRNAADYIVNALTEKGITNGSIGVTQNGSCCGNPAVDGFIERMAELDTSFIVLDTRLEGAEISEATNKITSIINEHPNIVGAFGATGGSPQSWAAAMENTGRTDLIVVGMDYVEPNMELVENGTISAIVCQPLYEEGGACAQALYELNNGVVFNASEDTWFEELEAPIAAKEDMPYYRDIWQKMYDYFGE